MTTLGLCLVSAAHAANIKIDWMRDESMAVARGYESPEGSPAPPVDAKLSVEKDFDYQGGDSKRWAIQKTDDYKVCYKACAEDSACKAYAFVPAGYQEENLVCYLKNDVRPVQIWKGIVTGRRY